MQGRERWVEFRPGPLGMARRPSVHRTVMDCIQIRLTDDGQHAHQTDRVILRG